MEQEWQLMRIRAGFIPRCVTKNGTTTVTSIYPVESKEGASIISASAKSKPIAMSAYNQKVKKKESGC